MARALLVSLCDGIGLEFDVPESPGGKDEIESSEAHLNKIVS
jgi:hypothetical protein